MTEIKFYTKEGQKTYMVSGSNIYKKKISEVVWKSLNDKNDDIHLQQEVNRYYC